MKIYSLFDRKVREFLALVVCPNDESCVRALRESLVGSASTVTKYPADFDLMCLGEFDVETGVIVPVVPALFVKDIASILRPEGG